MHIPGRLRLPLFLLLLSGLLVTACTGGPAQHGGGQPSAPGIRLPGSTRYDMADVLPLAPELRKSVLDNGLTYYIRQNGNPARRVTLYLVVASGSADEEDHQLGYAHFIEHMAFNGTDSFPKNELVNYLRSIGMRFGADINAYTSRENTVYMLEIPSDNLAIVNTGLQVLKEWATAITFDPVEVEKEKGVILEERRLRLGPNDQALANELPVLLGDSRHARRDPIGTEESIRNASPESLRAFYEQHYRPERMAVIVVGDINPDHATRAVRDIFNFEPRHSQNSPRTIHPVRPSADMSFAATFSNDFDQPLIQYQKIVPYKPETTIADYYDFMRNRVTIEIIRLRLANLTRAGGKSWINAGFSSDYFFGMTRIYSFGISTRPGMELEAFADLAEEVERIRQHGFTRTEFQRTIDTWRVWLSTLDIEDQDLRSASFADEYVRNFMYGEPVPGVTNERIYIRDALDKMTPEDLHKEALAILRNDEGFVAVRTKVGDWNNKLTLPAFDALLERARSSRLGALPDTVLQASLFDKLPAPGTISSESVLKDGTTQLLLDNGARVLLKPTAYDKDTVKFVAYAPGGFSNLPVADYTSLTLAPSLLAASGLGDMDALTLDLLTAPVRASLSWGMEEYARILQGETVRSDLDTFLRLVYLTAAEQGRDEAAFNQLRNQWAAQIETFVRDPDYRFQTSWNRHLYGDNHRLDNLSAERILAIDFNRTRQLVNQSFANASAFTYLLAGDFDVAEVKEMVKRHIGAIPAGNPLPTELYSPLRPRDGGQARIDYRLARENRASIRMVWTAETQWTYERQKTLEYLNHALNNRLLDALREDLGGTYIVSAFADLSPAPANQFTLVVNFDTDPEKAQDLIAEVKHEIEQLRSNGFTDMYIQQIRAAATRSLQGRLDTNDFWLNSTLRALRSNSSLADLRERELGSLRLIDNKLFRELAQELLINENSFVYVLLPAQ